MPEFKYVARDGQGKKTNGTIKGEHRDDVIGILRKQGLTVLSITEGAKKAGMGSIWSLQLGSKTPKPRVKGKDLVVFTRQFSTMISAGIPVLECLEILEEQADDKGFHLCLGKIISDVRSGSDLSEALSRHPRVFEKIYVNMIRAGEASGQLDIILSRLADYQESTEELKRTIKSALTYPAISLVMVMGITIFLLVFVIPKFKDIFRQLKIELPPVTKFVLLVSDIVRGYFLQLGLVLVALFFLIKWYGKTKRGGYQVDYIKLKLPIFGPLFRKVALSRFSRTFATLISSGVPILGALEIVASTSGNRVIEDAVNNARDSSRKGETLAQPLSQSSVFPPMVVRMIAIGEKSGALEKLLEKIADFYDSPVSATVEALTSMIEPLMIGVMGFLVGGMVLAVFMPIFKIQKSLARK